MNSTLVDDEEGGDNDDKEESDENEEATDVEITTTIFVPATKNSELFKAISDKQDMLKTKLSWSAKVIEKGGHQLYLC